MSKKLFFSWSLFFNEPRTCELQKKMVEDRVLYSYMLTLHKYNAWIFVIVFIFFFSVAHPIIFWSNLQRL